MARRSWGAGASAPSSSSSSCGGSSATSASSNRVEVDGGGNAADRRQRSDRREGSSGPERRGVKRKTSTLTYLLRTLGAIVVLVGVIVYTVQVTRPVYATRGSLGEELRKHAPEVAAAIAPLDSAEIDRFTQTPKFQEEKRNFYLDVMRLKQVDSARADSIAHFAVREAY